MFYIDRVNRIRDFILWVTSFAIVALALVAFALCGCTKLAPDKADPTHDVTWSSSLACDPASVSHPCPYLTFSTLVTFNVIPETVSETRADATRIALTWWGSTVTGDRGPVEEVAHHDLAGDLEIDTKGDDAGLRMAATIIETPDGYAGDVSWELDIVPGVTTFHLEIAGRNQ